MIIGVVSDTHVPQAAPALPKALLDGLAGCDMIVHAGDVTHPSVLDELSAIATLVAVRGNMDGSAVAMVEKRILEVERKRIGIVHGWGSHVGLETRIREAFEGGPPLDAIIFGHSHKAYCRRHGDVLLFNPGTPTDPRFSDRLTYGILTVGETIEGTIKTIR